MIATKDHTNDLFEVNIDKQGLCFLLSTNYLTMNFLKRLFAAKEDETIQKLVNLAYAKNEITGQDISLLKQDLDFLESPNKSSDENVELPVDPNEKFQVIYKLEETLLDNGKLSERKRSLLKKILTGFNLAPERLIEVIKYLKLNINEGVTVKGAYQRLSYLMLPSRY